MKKVDLFTVSDDGMRLVERLFACDGFTIPSPRNFSQPVDSFDIRLVRQIKIRRPSLLELFKDFNRELATAIRSLVF